MALFGKIASIFVEIKAPNAQLQSDLRSAEAQVRASSGRMKAESGSGLFAGLKEASSPAKGVTGAISGLIGIGTKIVSIATLIAGAVGTVVVVTKALVDQIKDAAFTAPQATEGIAKLQNQFRAGNFKKSADDIEGITIEIEKLRKSRATAIYEAQSKLFEDDYFKELSKRMVEYQNLVAKYQERGHTLRKNQAGDVFDPLQPTPAYMFSDYEDALNKYKSFKQKVDNILESTSSNVTGVIDEQIKFLSSRLDEVFSRKAKESADKWVREYERAFANIQSIQNGFGAGDVGAWSIERLSAEISDLRQAIQGIRN